MIAGPSSTRYPAAEERESTDDGKAQLTAGEEQITALLARAGNGDAAANERLFACIYEDLLQRARNAMRGAARTHVLQPTALLHEAYMRLVNRPRTWQNRGHFFAVAARAMRCILIDHGRRATREPRSVQLEEFVHAVEADVVDLAAFAEALVRLQERYERTAKVFDLYYFARNSVEEIADYLRVSEKTVYREIKLAKATIRKELAGD